MNNVFNPNQAIDTLRKNYQEIEELGRIVEEKGKAHALAEALLLDAENEARKEYFETKPCKLSELRDWIKYKTADETRIENTAKHDLRLAKGKLEILIEINNSVKASLRIAEYEYNNISTINRL